ncbi:MAG: M23 family metallopeptidase [Acidimicrobiales bacterium]
MAKGATVKAGQVVAYLGDSGNAESTGAHLHFEITRPDGTNINPTPSVDAALDRLVNGVVLDVLGVNSSDELNRCSMR